MQLKKRNNCNYYGLNCKNHKVFGVKCNFSRGQDSIKLIERNTNFLSRCKITQNIRSQSAKIVFDLRRMQTKQIWATPF